MPKSAKNALLQIQTKRKMILLQTRDLLYKARTHSHSFGRLATSRIVSAQGQRNLLFDIVSLSLFSAILEDTCFFLIGRLMMQRRGQLASPPGTLPRRLHLQRGFPHPSYNGLESRYLALLREKPGHCSNFPLNI